MTHETFWLTYPPILFSCETFYKIIPTKYMNYAAKLNSLTRLFIYLGIILALVFRNIIYLIIAFVGIIIIILLYYSNHTEKFDPTPKSDDTSEIKVCQTPECQYKLKMLDAHTDNSVDVYTQSQPQPQPLSDLEDQTKFARWLYGDSKTCKEDQLYCSPYEDLRFNK